MGGLATTYCTALEEAFLHLSTATAPSRHVFGTATTQKLRKLHKPVMHDLQNFGIARRLRARTVGVVTEVSKCRWKCLFQKPSKSFRFGPDISLRLFDFVIDQLHVLYHFEKHLVQGNLGRLTSIRHQAQVAKLGEGVGIARTLCMPKLEARHHVIREVSL